MSIESKPLDDLIDSILHGYLIDIKILKEMSKEDKELFITLLNLFYEDSEWAIFLIKNQYRSIKIH